MINLKQFKQDLEQIQNSTAITSNLRPLTEKQRQSMTSLNQAFISGKISYLFVINLKRMDKQNTGHLDKFTIMKVINATLKERGGTKKVEMNQKQVEGILGAVNTDRRGYFSYNELLQ